MKVIPYSALYVDLSFAHLFKYAYQALKPQDVKKAISSLESLFIQDPFKEKLLITICVRGALDLLFQGLNYPPGSEILMSSMNIPDMVKVVRYHGFIPVPIDIDLHTLKPKVDVIKKAITKKTKAIIIAWIYGSYNYADEIYKVCKDNGLYVIEDNAESFFDLKYNGNQLADASLFSFGTIKLNTALGGALMVIRNNELLYRKMNTILNNYPLETSNFFFKRIIKAIMTMMALNNTYLNGYGRYVLLKLGIEYKETAIGLVRGFHPSDDFLGTFRKRLPHSMVIFLYLRMKSYDKMDFLRGTKRQLEGQQILQKAGIVVPGHQADKKFYWLYPIIVPDQELCYQILNKKGIDAYKGATQLRPVLTPVGSTYEEPKETLEFFDKILYLPIHKNVPLEYVQKICREVADVVKMVEQLKRNKGVGLKASKL